MRCSCQRGGSTAAGFGSGAGVDFASRAGSLLSLALEGASDSRAVLRARVGLSGSDLPDLSATDVDLAMN